jgi:hypothetical protein
MGACADKKSACVRSSALPKNRRIWPKTAKCGGIWACCNQKPDGDNGRPMRYTKLDGPIKASSDSSRITLGARLVSR